MSETSVFPNPTSHAWHRHEVILLTYSCSGPCTSFAICMHGDWHLSSLVSVTHAGLIVEI